jgi:tight adherence protein C
MPIEILITVSAIFLLVATLTGWMSSSVLARRSPELQRLQRFAGAGAGGVHVEMSTQSLVDHLDPRLRRMPGVPKSPKEMKRLQRRLALAGYHDSRAMLVLAAAKLITPVVFAAATVALLGLHRGWIVALFTGAIGYLLPGIAVSRQIERRKTQIANGLPDALDLLIVCVEAGCGLDQALLKASDELALTYPPLAAELRMITTEVRAGKPRLEAFKNFAARTKVDDVRSLVSLLVQTDRFGTSIAQALRTHADTARTKRRQRAEERAAKVGVKMVFPLVLFLFPALYVVILGPAVIQFLRVFLTAVQR